MEAPAINNAKKQQLLGYMRKINCGVVSTSAMDRSPQAAFVNIAVTDDLDLVFETLNTSRKFRNLEHDPRVAVVMSGSGERTVQLEGIARELFEMELEELESFYYDQCPHNLPHQGWPGLTYVRVRPRWIRFSDYGMPWKVEEFFIAG